MTENSQASGDFLIIIEPTGHKPRVKSLAMAPHSLSIQVPDGANTEGEGKLHSVLVARFRVSGLETKSRDSRPSGILWNPPDYQMRQAAIQGHDSTLPEDSASHRALQLLLLL